MDVGDIVEFSTGDDFKLGVVSGRVGGSKVLLITADSTMRARHEEIVDTYDHVDETSAEAAREALAALESRAATYAAELGDLEAIWKAVPRGAAFHDDVIVDAALGDNETHSKSAALLALRRALRDDQVYFRRRKDGRIQARTPEHVEETLRQRETHERTAAAREAFLAAVVARLDERPGPFPSLENPDFREFIAALQAFAAAGDDFEDRTDALELLEEIEAASSITIPGTAELKAFHLMELLGIWTAHQNLFVVRYGIREAFPDDVIERTEEILDDYWFPEEWREDMRDWWTLTIDGATTEDIDDALSIRPTMEGGWTVAAHIADPSAYVPIGDPIDLEARRRGSSIYPPSGTIPMFPKELSDGQMSLLPRKDRAALSLIIDFSPELELESWRFTPSVIRVNSRMTYEYADELLTSDTLSHEAETLAALQFIADELFYERKENGAVHIQLPEPQVKVSFDADGAPIVKAGAVSDTTSRQLIAEFMVLYNRLIAEFMDRHGLPAIYRAQNAPDYASGADALPEGPAREFARLKTMRRSDVSTSPARHYSMAVPMYVQATSPIRRYSDLVMQRQVTAFLREQPLPYTLEDIYAMVLDVEKAIHEAKVIQRESTTYWLTWHLGHLPPGTRLRAVVLDYKDPRHTLGTILLPEFGLRTTMNFRKPPAIGEAFDVEVEKADARREKLVFRQA